MHTRQEEWGNKAGLGDADLKEGMFGREKLPADLLGYGIGVQNRSRKRRDAPRFPALVPLDSYAGSSLGHGYSSHHWGIREEEKWMISSRRSLRRLRNSKAFSATGW
jgi:hypothetical protein